MIATESTANRQVDLVPVQPKTDLLGSVQRLGRKYSRWLGFYPEGAFEESAQKGQIIAAVGPGDKLLGYVIYRLSRGYVSVVHLCVDEPARGTGLSRRLFNELKERTGEYFGVKLRCRRDFPASDLWPKLGFRPMHESPGRSASGALLTTWVYPYGHPDLFTTAAEDDPRPRAALMPTSSMTCRMERSIVASPRSLPTGYPPKSSSASHQRSTSRSTVLESSDKRERRRAFASQFESVGGDDAEERRIRDQLRSLFPAVLSESEESDLRQLTKAIAGGASFFVTWDQEQLDRSAEVQGGFGLAIVRPLELVLELDSRLREAEYVPARVAGA
jgi:GNAT superfamily N-acetyltransferase